MNLPHDLIGKTFGRLKISSFSHRNESSKQYWNCSCDCGKEKIVCRTNLLNGHVKSCGCFRSEDSARRCPGKKHGHSSHKSGRTRTYRSWSSMMERCYKSWCKDYVYYGARGIKVETRWHSFGEFLLDMGERPEGRTLDRIDNEKGYSSQNCRWATYKQQANNRRKPCRIKL